MTSPPPSNEKQQSTSSADNSLTETLQSDTSFVIMEKNIELGNIAAKACSGKDVLILLGNTGAGKSVLFNYLLNILMKAYSPAEKGISASLLDFVVDVVNSQSNAAIIGHTDEATTLIPHIATLHNTRTSHHDKAAVVCCDCPGFLDNRGVEISVANAVNIRNILFAARGVKVILLLEYASLTTAKQTMVDTVAKIARNLFGSDERFCEHASSVLLGITKVPTSSNPLPLEDLKANIAQCGCDTIRCLAENVFVFDPLERKDLRFAPVSTREELLRRVEHLPSISNTREVFRTSISAEDCIAVEEICQGLKSKIEESIREEDLMKASKYFQKLKSLIVLEHPVVKSAMVDTRKNIKNIANTTISEIKVHLAEDKLGKSKEMLEDLGKLVATFEDKEADEQLTVLEKKYKRKKWWRVVKRGAIVGGAATAAIVGTAVGLILAPAVPIGIVGGVLIASLGSAAELGVVTGVTKTFTDKVESFSAKPSASEASQSLCSGNTEEAVGDKDDEKL